MNRRGPNRRRHSIANRPRNRRSALTRLLLDGALNAFRDLARRPRPHLPPAGSLRLYFHSSREDGRASAVPRSLRRWFERFRPVWAAAAHGLCQNEDAPLSEKLTRTITLLIQQINLFDFLAVDRSPEPLRPNKRMASRRPSRDRISPARLLLSTSCGGPHNRHSKPSPSTTCRISARAVSSRSRVRRRWV